MYRLEVSKSDYELFRDRLYELHPEIRVRLFSCNEPLEKLGFAESAPCTVFVDIDDAQRESLLNELDRLEADASNTSGELPDHDAEMQFRRYECLWQYLFYAEKVIDKENLARYYLGGGTIRSPLSMADNVYPYLKFRFESGRRYQQKCIDILENSTTFAFGQYSSLPRLALSRQIYYN